MKGSTKKNIIKLVVLTIGVMLVYSLSSVITNYLFFPETFELERSVEGKNEEAVDPNDIQLTELNLDLSNILANLLNSDFFDNLNASEKAELLEDMFGDGLGEYLEENELSADEFMDEYQEELGGMLESLGGEGFNSDILDNFPPELAAILLAKTIFYVYESNPSQNPWNNKEDTLFKISAYDQYDLRTYSWNISNTVDNMVNYYAEEDPTDKMLKIKNEIQVLQQSTQPSIPTFSPHPRILYGSTFTSPYDYTSLNLQYQFDLKGTSAEIEFGLDALTNSVNITYDLLYDSNDYEDSTYYEAIGLNMADYSGSQSIVTSCLMGPYDEGSTIEWSEYRSNNPYFNQVASELESFQPFIDAGNTYAKADAIVNFVGENFVYNVLGGMRPGSGDPIEWFCENKETSQPFEFSYVTVALARLNGISARYVSGYKYNELLATQLGGSYADPSEGNQLAYPFRVGNMYTWAEFFIPTTSTAGDWVEFDNRFNAVPTDFNIDDLEFNLKFDGDWYPDFGGIDRLFGEFNEGTEVELEVNYTISNSPRSNQEIEIYDVSYDRTLGTAYTNLDGIATHTLELENMEPGPHILNVTASYMGVSFANVSVLNVIDDVDIVTNLNASEIITQATVPEAVDITGYMWDPYLNRPVKNVRISNLCLMHSTNTEPIPSYFTLSPNSSSSDINGNITLTTDIPGYPNGDTGRNYTIISSFNGIFDITNDISQFSSGYQAIFDTIFGGGDALMIFSNYEDYSKIYNNTITLKTNSYHEYTFSVNTTFSNNNTLAIYPSGPTYGERNNNLLLNFTANLVDEEFSPSGVSINVYDESESDRLVTTFVTDGNGYGNEIYNVSAHSQTNPEDWTVGLHLLRLEWDNPSRSDCYTKFWVVIQSPVFVNQTTEYYTAGSFNSTYHNNIYYIDSRNPGDADQFTIEGTIQDLETGEDLLNYTVYYELFDNSWNLMASSNLNLGSSSEFISTAAPFSEDFLFSGTINLGSAPLRTNVNFTGEFDGGDFGWNNSWNSLWSGYFGSLNDTSDGTIELADPTAYHDINQYYNGTYFYDISPDPYSRNVTEGDNLLISEQFVYFSTPIENATVTLRDLTDGFTWNALTDANGNVNFTVILNSSMSSGIHQYRLDISYPTGTYTYTNQSIIFEVNYIPELVFNFTFNLDSINFDDAVAINNRNKTISDNATFSLILLNQALNGVSGATVTLTDLTQGGLTWLTTTNGSGFAEIIIYYTSSITPGIHQYNLSVSFIYGANTLINQSFISINYDPLLAYNVSYYKLDGILFEDLAPYDDRIKGIGDSINISCLILNNSIGQPNADVYLLINGTLNATTTTDVNGIAYFIINFDDTNDTAIYVFTIQLSLDGGLYTFTDENEVWVRFDPDILYTFIPRLDGTDFDDNSGIQTIVKNLSDSIHFSVKFLNNSLDESGANITLTDMSNGTVWSLLTDGSGHANFTWVFNLINIPEPGIHQYNLSVFALVNGIYPYIRYEFIKIEYRDPGLDYFLNPQWNGTDFDSVVGADINYSKSFIVSCTFEDPSFNPIDSVHVTLIDLTNGTMWHDNTTGAGFASFTVYFNENVTNGLHEYKINLTYNHNGYPFELQNTISVQFNDPTDVSMYNFSPYYNTQLFSFVSGIPNVIIFDYSNFSCTFTHNEQVIQNAAVSLADSNGSIWDNTTNISGIADFSGLVYYNEYTNDGDHIFTINVSYTFGLYTIYTEQTLTINFNHPNDAFNYDASLDHFDFDILGDPSTRPLNLSDSFYIDCLFKYPNGTAISGASVTLSTDINITTWPNSTDATGNAGFILYYDDDTDHGTHQYTIYLTYTFGDFIITKSETVTIQFNDPDPEFEFAASLDTTLFDDVIGTPAYYIYDTFNLSCELLFRSNPVSGASVTISDSNGTSWNSLSTDSNGWVNQTILFGEYTNDGIHTYTITLTYTLGVHTINRVDTVTVNFTDPTIPYTTTPYLEEAVLGNDLITINDGGHFNITYEILNGASGQLGATILLEDLTNSTNWATHSDWNISSGFNGIGSIYVFYDSSHTQVGPHQYNISILYNFGIYSISDDITFWVVFNSPLNISASRTETTFNFSMGITIEYITITGEMVDVGTNNGYDYSTMAVWILDNSSNEVTGDFTITTQYYNHATDGTFEIRVYLKTSAFVGEYTVIIGFDGTMRNDAPADLMAYNNYDIMANSLIANSSSSINFTIYDADCYLTTGYTYDTEGMGFIVGGTNVNISGILYYSTDDSVNYTGQEIVITLVEEITGIQHNSTLIITNVNGYYEWVFLLDWNIEYYFVSYAGSEVTFCLETQTGHQPLIE